LSLSDTTAENQAWTVTRSKKIQSVAKIPRLYLGKLERKHDSGRVSHELAQHPLAGAHGQSSR
jgi:hypothetical protein